MTGGIPVTQIVLPMIVKLTGDSRPLLWIRSPRSSGVLLDPEQTTRLSSGAFGDQQRNHPGKLILIRISPANVVTGITSTSGFPGNLRVTLSSLPSETN